MKKPPGDIIILHMCTINVKYMMYGSWDMEPDGQNVLSFWTIFCTVTPLITQKSKFWKNEKKNTWRYYHFTHVHHKWQSHDVWFLRYGEWKTELFVILDHFLPFCPTNSPKNQKPPGDIIISHMCTKNYDQMMHGSWDMVDNRQTDRWTDGRTGGQMEKVTYRGGCPT